MTDSNQNAASNASEAQTNDRPLAQMRVADLQALASKYGVKGAARMRKSQLIEAITEARGDSTADASVQTGGAQSTPTDVPESSDSTPAVAEVADQAGAADAESDQDDTERKGRSGKGSRNNRNRGGSRSDSGDDGGEQEASDGTSAPKTLDDIVLPPARDEEQADDDSGESASESENNGARKRNRNRNRNKSSEDAANKQQDTAKQNQDRRRDRKRRDDVDPEIAPDDVLLPIAGILDVLDNYAFVRTSGYLAGANDVYVSLGQVKKYNLRKGDAIVGAIRQPREGDYHSGRQKYNALVRIDSVNGEAPEANKERAEFDALTALYPQERLTLETSAGHAAQRMIDLFAPIGKGSRGLIIAPPKSGKSILLERIAGAITENYPETHLMLVLVDERPEEVTRLTRTIHGEVISATFDMPAENHTTIAELAIERAKRLVELGLDVVVLLDSITQLGRAYNISAPTTGRVIDGGVDASALYPPKRFFGAARNVENGGSLTILATAMVETGSRTDEVILEEFAGTANMELRLSRKIADRRIFPAIDIQQSSTLHEEALLSDAELQATWSVRRELGENAQVSLQAVLERLDATEHNAQFVASVKARGISTEAGR